MNQVARKEVETPKAVTVASTETTAIVAMIERAARDDTVNIDKMRELLAMRKEIMAAAAEQSFNEAMAKAQAEMTAIAADANNSQTRSKYASYYALDKAVRPIYTKHGFALSFNTEEGAPTEHVRVVCYVTCAGHTRKYHIDMPADGKGAKGGDVMTKTHATGSAMTYGERYLLRAIFNLAVGADDDGNKAKAIDPITTAEVDEITKIIEVLGAEVPKVLAYVSKKAKMDVKELKDIPSGYYADVKLALRNWASKQGTGDGN